MRRTWLTSLLKRFHLNQMLRTWSARLQQQRPPVVMATRAPWWYFALMSLGQWVTGWAAAFFFSDAIACPYVCLSVCLSLTFVHPTQAIEIFGNFSTPFGTRLFVDIQEKFYGDRPRVTHPSEELNTRGVAEYSDFRPIERCLGNGAT